MAEQSLATLYGYSIQELKGMSSTLHISILQCEIEYFQLFTRTDEEAEEQRNFSREKKHNLSTLKTLIDMRIAELEAKEEFKL